MFPDVKEDDANPVVLAESDDVDADGYVCVTAPSQENEPQARRAPLPLDGSRSPSPVPSPLASSASSSSGDEKSVEQLPDSPRSQSPSPQQSTVTVDPILAYQHAGAADLPNLFVPFSYPVPMRVQEFRQRRASIKAAALVTSVEEVKKEKPPGCLSRVLSCCMRSGLFGSKKTSVSSTQSADSASSVEFDYSIPDRLESFQAVDSPRAGGLHNSSPKLTRP